MTSARSKQCPQCGIVFTAKHKNFSQQVCCSLSCKKKFRDGPPLERLKKKFKVNEETGCWEWQATRNKLGYGRVSIDGKNILAHRAMYELLVGPIPDGKSLHHKCFNPRCCNPDHLLPMTHAENRQQADVAIFTPEKVRLIRRAFGMKNFKMGTRRVASKLGVKRHVVHDILRGKSWMNVM